MAPARLEYALVARPGPVVLAEHSLVTGNASLVAISLLEKLPQQGGDARASYISDKHVFHILVSDGLVYLCMADEVGKRHELLGTLGFAAPGLEYEALVTKEPGCCARGRAMGARFDLRFLQVVQAAPNWQQPDAHPRPLPSPLTLVQAAGKRVPFAFLEDVKERFLALYSAVAHQAGALSRCCTPVSLLHAVSALSP